LGEGNGYGLFCTSIRIFQQLAQVFAESGTSGEPGVEYRLLILEGKN
jgi:hypothetical protein